MTTQRPIPQTRPFQMTHRRTGLGSLPPLVAGRLMLADSALAQPDMRILGAALAEPAALVAPVSGLGIEVTR